MMSWHEIMKPFKPHVNSHLSHIICHLSKAILTSQMSAGQHVLYPWWSQGNFCLAIISWLDVQIPPQCLLMLLARRRFPFCVLQCYWLGSQTQMVFLMNTFTCLSNVFKTKAVTLTGLKFLGLTFSFPDGFCYESDSRFELYDRYCSQGKTSSEQFRSWALNVFECFQWFEWTVDPSDCIRI